LPKVRGIALGAIGEFRESANLLIEGLAHEGALKTPVNSARATTRQPAYGQIHWLLKRRPARLAVIAAAESRYAAFGYTEGTAQQAAAAHAQAQAQDDWRYDGAYRQRKAETAAPFFGGFGGGLDPPPLETQSCCGYPSL
jgi:hypothetical protein